jgi:hypothetical protein
MQLKPVRVQVLVVLVGQGLLPGWIALRHAGEAWRGSATNCPRWFSNQAKLWSSKGCVE